MISWLAGVIVTAFAVFLSLRWAFRAGRENTRASKAEEINHAALEALSVRDRLRRNDSFARRVRRRFTR